MRSAAVPLVVLLVLADPAFAQNWRSVKGPEIYALFAGKEFGDGVHSAYRFGTDLSFAGTEMGKDVRGTWRVEADQMCWTWEGPAAEEECYDLDRDGKNIRFFKNGMEAWSGQFRK